MRPQKTIWNDGTLFMKSSPCQSLDEKFLQGKCGTPPLQIHQGILQALYPEGEGNLLVEVRRSTNRATCEEPFRESNEDKSIVMKISKLKSKKYV